VTVTICEMTRRVFRVSVVLFRGRPALLREPLESFQAPTAWFRRPIGWFRGPIALFRAPIALFGDLTRCQTSRAPFRSPHASFPSLHSSFRHCTRRSILHSSFRSLPVIFLTSRAFYIIALAVSGMLTRRRATGRAGPVAWDCCLEAPQLIWPCN
jgi:hypothetical protein